jgi:hypothetical protein
VATHRLELCAKLLAFLDGQTGHQAADHPEDLVVAPKWAIGNAAEVGQDELRSRGQHLDGVP